MSESDFRTVDPDDADHDRAAGEASPEAPEADLAEQRRDVLDELTDEFTNPPDDVDPGDAAEQQLSVEFDEDDYR